MNEYLKQFSVKLTVSKEMIQSSVSSCVKILVGIKEKERYSHIGLKKSVYQDKNRQI